MKKLFYGLGAAAAVAAPTIAVISCGSNADNSSAQNTSSKNEFVSIKQLSSAGNEIEFRLDSVVSKEYYPSLNQWDDTKRFEGISISLSSGKTIDLYWETWYGAFTIAATFSTVRTAPTPHDANVSHEEFLRIKSLLNL